MDRLHDRIISDSERNWPQNVDDHFLLCGKSEYWKQRYAAVEKSSKIDDIFFDDRFPEPAAAIHLAKQFGRTSVLPYAFFTLAQIDPSMDWDDLRKPKHDGSPNTEGRKKLAQGVRSARWRLLDRDDLFRLHLGIRTLRTYSETVLNPVSEGFHIRCTKYIHEWIRRHGRPEAEGIPVYLANQGIDPFQLLDALSTDIQAFSISNTTCPACNKRAQRTIMTQKKKLWDALPAIFQFSGQ